MAGKPTYEELEHRVQELERAIPPQAKAGESLIQERETFRVFIEESPLGVCLIGKDGQYQYINNKFIELFGYTLGDIPTGREWFAKAYPDPDYRNRVLSTWINDLKQPEIDESLRRSFVVKCKDGSEKAVQFRMVRIQTGEQFVIFEDITDKQRAEEELAKYRIHLEELVEERASQLKKRNEQLQLEIQERQRAEEALRANEEKYRALFDESIDAIYITTREGRFLDANRSAQHLFGYTKRDMIDNLNVRELYVNPEEREKFQAKIESQGSVRNYSIKIRKKDGTEMDCLLNATVRLSHDRHVLGYQGIIRDVTEYKLAQEALRESEARYRAIVEAFDGLIYICSQDFRIEFMNKRLIERTGYDATGALCYEALHGLDSVCSWCVNEKVFRGETVRWEVLSPKDHCWYYIVNTPIPHSDGTMSKQAMILDITERKQMEEALVRSSEKIKRFAYSVSHDLKNPAVGIYGLTKRLYAKYADLLGEKGRVYCDQIIRAAEEISALVQQINIYISTSETPLHIEKINLKDTVRIVREAFSAQLDIRGISWSEPDDPPEIHADRLIVLRVLRNLADNALKYGGEDLTEIRLGYEDAPECHVLSVSNNGTTIKEKDLEKIFGPFQRFDTSRGIEGAGLGLAIVKESAEQHGGKVWVESAPDKWTTFYLSISKKLQKDL